MSNLVDKINALSREGVFEAVRMLGYDTFEIEADQATEEATALAPLTKEPYQNIEDLEQLARLTLIAVALTPEYEADVQSALDGIGQKQIVLGGLEIVALSIVALGALHVLVSKGKTSEKKKITITDTKITIEEEVTYGISEKLASILKSISL